MIQFAKRMAWLTVSGVVIIGIQKVLVNNIMDSNGWIQWVIAGFSCVCVAGVILMISSALMYRRELINAFDVLRGMLSRKRR